MSPVTAISLALRRCLRIPAPDHSTCDRRDDLPRSKPRRYCRSASAEADGRDGYADGCEPSVSCSQQLVRGRASRNSNDVIEEEMSFGDRVATCRRVGGRGRSSKPHLLFDHVVRVAAGSTSHQLLRGMKLTAHNRQHIIPAIGFR